VFSSGIYIGLNGVIPVGGHVDPSLIVGDNLVWKNDTKNKTSEMVNRIIPHHRPVVNSLVCMPWYVPSQVMSRHH
jgi:hypothetical protein